MSKELSYLHQIGHVDGEVGEVAHGQPQDSVGHHGRPDVDVDLQQA